VLEDAMRFVLGLIFGLILVGAAGAFMVYGGRVSVAATTPPDMLDKLAPTARDRAIARLAPAMTIAADPAAARRGMEHYDDNCLPCHGAPGTKPAEFAQGMNPSPPELDGSHTQAFADGALFWIVKNGIRASGMPAFGGNHQDAEIQDIVAFVRHLPKLTDEERRTLAAAQPHEHHHEGAEKEGGSAHEEHHH
jgi:mono/diheme cytochrome c family protein